MPPGLHEVVEPSLKKQWEEMVRKRNADLSAPDPELDAAEAEIYDFIRSERQWPRKTSDPRAREWLGLHMQELKEQCQAIQAEGYDFSTITPEQMRTIAAEQHLVCIERELGEWTASSAQDREEARALAQRINQETAEDELQALEAEIHADLEALLKRRHSRVLLTADVAGTEDHGSTDAGGPSSETRGPVAPADSAP
mmetsp:Transcript_67525/g.195214  ORF Transcript_67525/g.195214 Transcript_67525/m.195214 type:complete len:198 (-) Transcript_67525:66-659(-)|eukprot:CAMPEP_0176065178 /NCGR_PEP_ID=MMETSP0120_2-20121206/32515_1 /TAXON_ID=160619 /ORGANISM="Kryptoperidinium foliaceum, Strain CCMP 1326" /LENGTH=197 /DNA_ID=CAMNT_0017398763 /DNA_START=57 /DNA_END=650 /DNA_ORIENTATION=+